MPFALDSDPSASEISEAINYLLSNFSIGNTVDPVTGQVVAPGGIVVGYIYQYLAVKYADDQFGTGFSNSPTGKNYYGVNNSQNAAESSNPADYIWYEATGGFGTTKFLWYISTGGRQIQFAVSATAPDTAWLVDPGSSIDLDIVTSGNIPVIAESFVTYFTPSILFVPRTGNPLTPQFTGIAPTMYATNGGVVIPYSGATTDSNVAFVNNSWRIGNSSTTGFGDISYTNITIGNPTDMGDYAEWPAPTAMTGTAYIDVPVRFKDSLGNVTQASVAALQLAFADPGVNGDNGPQIDFSGFTGFSVNNANVYTPATATLSAIATNVTSPTYSWSITGATPTSSTNSSVVVTPNSSATSVVVQLTVNGSNLLSAVTVTKTLPVTFDGVPGTAGANGVQSAFPSIYIWTGSSAVPTRPSTTSTFTWATGAYTAPSGWSTESPTNTTAGNYLWQITVPLNVSATTTTSTLDWTNTSYPIRCIAYNGADGPTGATGSAGSATFLVDRGSGTSSAAPTPTECISAIGRTAVIGDIATVSYNSGSNATVWRYTTSWITQSTYLTGDLIVNGTITAPKLSVTQLSAISANLGAVTAGELTIAGSGGTPLISGTTMTGSGTHLYNDGRFAMGNSTTNITFNGTTATLNGFSSISYTDSVGSRQLGGIGNPASLPLTPQGLPLNYAVCVGTFGVSIAGNTKILYTGRYTIQTTEPTAVYCALTINSGLYSYPGTVNISTVSTGSLITIVSTGTTNWNTVFGTAGKTYITGDSGTVAAIGGGTGTCNVLTAVGFTNYVVGGNSSAMYKTLSFLESQTTVSYISDRPSLSVGNYAILQFCNINYQTSTGSALYPTVAATINIGTQFLAQQIRV